MLSNLYKTLYNISMRRRAEGEGSDVRAVLENENEVMFAKTSRCLQDLSESC